MTRFSHLLTTTALALMAASPALAGNRATIVQAGSTLTAQTAQNGGSNGKIDIDQSGARNIVRLVQSDVDLGLDRGNGAATAAFIVQAGHDNGINTLVTATAPNLGQRELAYGQQNLIVQVTQDGEHNAINFDQSGNGHRIDVVQHGGNNEVDMLQMHDGNEQNIIQQGTNGAARFRQTGSYGTAKLNQSGNLNQIASNQSGDFDYADLYQSGSANYAAVNQYADHDEALLNQHGDNGLVVVQQTTANANANLSQVGTGNVIFTTQ